jgi:NTE family protein
VNALVLSGGGMFGAWQAGAWQALQPVFKPDLIVGASIGAINGWMIASRCSPDEIAGRWRSHGFEGGSSDGKDPGGFSLPGILSGVPVLNMARQLTKTYRPEIPLALVCTRVPRLRAQIFRSDELTADHLYASCAVPIILPARRLPDGQSYGDGGFLGPVPAWAAAKLGATTILVIHVLPPMPFWLDWKIRAAQFLARHDDTVPAGVAVIRVGPDRQLGAVRDSAVWDAGNVERWLAEGREAGERAAAVVPRA